ncbi:NAD(P)/FAD-dependent oxidoreductase [bacterium]|nr:NAD(P)/FAD-dependent oxidoreductase [bacterium]
MSTSLASQRFDIAIIGAGPAGLEAAITAKIRNKSVIIFESGATHLAGEHKIENYLGLPDVTGQKLNRKFVAHAKNFDLEITADRITEVIDFGEFFSIQGENNLYEARSVILATGSVRATPLPGETKFLGHGVSYCATCDGRAYRDKDTVVIAYAASDETETRFLCQLAAHVYYYPQYADAFSQEPPPKNLELAQGRPANITQSEDKKMVVSFGESTVSVDGVFIFRPTSPPWRLLPDLNIEGNRVVIDRAGKTNLPGVFAAGDLTGAPYQYIKAAGEGNVAALSAVTYLDTVSKLQSL